ncbi:MAG: hypothetical protein IJT43_09280 [Stomatobaculum sp.]|nr:hypothetical protein [Stomatobaculum sp.]
MLAFSACFDVFDHEMGVLWAFLEIGTPVFSKNRGAFFSNLPKCAQQALKSSGIRLKSSFSRALRGADFQNPLKNAQLSLSSFSAPWTGNWKLQKLFSVDGFSVIQKM